MARTVALVSLGRACRMVRGRARISQPAFEHVRLTAGEVEASSRFYDALRARFEARFLEPEIVDVPG